MSGYIKKELKDGKVILKSRTFPYNINKYKAKNHLSLIGVGGNLGDAKRRFNKLFIYLKRDRFLKVIATSIIFKNPPFGYLEQAYFYNTLILIESKLTPMQLLKHLQRIENHFGRKRLFKDAPRTLDLDIIFFENKIVKKEPTLIVPHPHWQERESVTLPLKYLKGVKCLTKVL